MFERVYTVTKYYDGPVQGVADLGGTPHLYKAEWDDKRDEYSDIFLLAPIDAATLTLVLEDWAIWRRWEDAFHRGLAPEGSDPALPDDRERHGELQKLLTGRLTIDPERSVRKHGEFRVLTEAPGPGRLADLEVRWSDLQEMQDLFCPHCGDAKPTPVNLWHPSDEMPLFCSVCEKQFKWSELLRETPTQPRCLHDGPKQLRPDGLRYQIVCMKCEEPVGDAPMSPDEDKAVWYHGGTYRAEMGVRKYEAEVEARGPDCDHRLEELRADGEILRWCRLCNYSVWQRPD